MAAGDDRPLFVEDLDVHGKRLRYVHETKRGFRVGGGRLENVSAHLLHGVGVGYAGTRRPLPDCGNRVSD